MEIVDHPADRTTRCFDRQLAAFVDLVSGRADQAVPGFAEGIASLELAELVARHAAALPAEQRETP